MTTASYPNLPLLRWLLLTLILVVSPHLNHLAWWIPCLLIILLGWRYWLTYSRPPKHLPGAWIQLLITSFILTGIFWNYRTWFGRDAGVAMLIALAGLKFLEMNQPRDALLVCFLSYFLITTHFFYSQSIPMVLYLGLVVTIVTATLISLNDLTNNVPWWQRLRLAGTLLLQAIPLMLVLFVLFPRLSGALWALPKDAHEGLSGLSDNLSLGNISELSLSDDIAFRVKFNAEIPPPAYRYWRGPVLWRSTGREWKTNSQQQDVSMPLNLHPTGKPYDYTITLEPHNERWLFAMDLPTAAPVQGNLMDDYQILSPRPIQQRLRYNLRSYTHYRAELMTSQFRRLALQLPKDQHPQARALAQQWQRKYSQPAAIIQAALQYFKQQPFFYTYTPPLLGGDPVDEFIFQTRQGFCEHYAVAFTVLMRAAGIPTRIVTGYLGGRENPIGNYLVVRQRDAHAWVESWVSPAGWIRIDPTAAVAPERIADGIDFVLPPEFAPLGIALDRNSAAVQLWQQFGHTWDAMNNSWNQWVLGYDMQRQRQFLNSLGLEKLEWRGMMLTMVLLLVGLLMLIATWSWLRSRPRERDPVLKIYHRFCHKLARQGLPRHPSEGPLSFATRVSTARPELAAAVQQFMELYVRVRYRDDIHQLAQLRATERKFL